MQIIHNQHTGVSIPWKTNIALFVLTTYCLCPNLYSVNLPDLSAENKLLQGICLIFWVTTGDMPLLIQGCNFSQCNDFSFNTSFYTNLCCFNSSDCSCLIMCEPDISGHWHLCFIPYLWLQSESLTLVGVLNYCRVLYWYPGRNCLKMSWPSLFLFWCIN